MPRTCTICSHAQRAEIDAALVAGEPYRGIAQRFRVSPDAVYRHRAHVPAALARAKDAAEVAHGDTLLEQVTGLQARTLAILTKAEKTGDLPTALRAIGEARRNLELLGKLAGELQEHGDVIVINAAWIDLRGVILAALGPYPAARVAVAQALQKVGDGGFSFGGPGA